MIKLISDTKPDVMVLEKLYAHYRHPTTAYLLGQARGVICLACATKNIPLVEYAATRVKKAIVGRGLASKNQVQRMVANTLSLSSLPRYLDVTDALALAIAHSYMVRSKV
jgi:crossover junction endodeoxyribonuclease RuvC